MILFVNLIFDIFSHRQKAFSSPKKFIWRGASDDFNRRLSPGLSILELFNPDRKWQKRETSKQEMARVTRGMDSSWSSLVHLLFKNLFLLSILQKKVSFKVQAGLSYGRTLVKLIISITQYL